MTQCGTWFLVQHSGFIRKIDINWPNLHASKVVNEANSALMMSEMFRGGACAVLRANCGRAAAIAKVFIKETFFAFMPLARVFSQD